VNLLLASEFKGKEVFAAGMKSIGAVDDLMIGVQGYALTDLVVKVRKEAARRIFGERFTLRSTRIRIPISGVDKIGDIIILRYTVDKLQEQVQKL
jgi:sporulation protein YlmC with PRC-barrel domain